ncbi:MAG TPA: hypothetical protein VNZ58_12525 [Thermomicrobiales bacterium]|nr:hypothetical protein [Thermomicrobiales bacterium]
MNTPDPVEIIAGVPLIVIAPALVELAKRMGMPVRFAGVVAMGVATMMLACADLAMGTVPSGADVVPAVARWVLGGVVYGLAAAGLYSQVRVIEKGDRGA